MNAFSFGSLMAKHAEVPNMFNNMRASGQLQPGQKFVGGQLISGPGAKPLSAAQQEEVDSANQMQNRFNAIGASRGGAGRAGMTSSPPPQSAQDQLNAYRVQQAKSDRAAAMQRQGLNANNPADLAKFKGGWTGPLPPSTYPGKTPTPQLQQQAIQPKTPTPQFQQRSIQPKPPTPQLQQQSQPRMSPPQPQSMLRSARPVSYSPPQPKVTTMQVDNAALQRQMRQLQQQPPVQSQNQPAPSRFVSPLAAAQSSPRPPQAGPLSAPMSATSTSFNNATGQQDPPHIITTDNGRKFNTQTKQFLDGRPGGFAR
jgi:hypothetical protein